MQLGAFVEIECGQERCGCAPGSETVVELARAIIASPQLQWRGLHVYRGGRVRTFMMTEQTSVESTARGAVEPEWKRCTVVNKPL